MKCRPSVACARLSVCFAVALVLSCAGCVRLYSAEPIEAWVVDAETGKPVEGVVVTANWQSEIHTMGGRIPGEQVTILEAVADAQGRFHFPSWGPKLSTKGVIQEKSPQLLLFKPGYEYVLVTNSIGADPKHEWTRSTAWIPRQIGMRKQAGQPADYAKRLSGLSSTLGSVLKRDRGSCDWQKVPEMLRALDRQDTVFQRLSISPLSLVASLKANDKSFVDRGCGSIINLLKGA